MQASFLFSITRPHCIILLQMLLFDEILQIGIYRTVGWLRRAKNTVSLRRVVHTGVAIPYGGATQYLSGFFRIF